MTDPRPANPLVRRAVRLAGGGSEQAGLTDAGLAVLARVASQGASAAEMASALGIGTATLSRMRRRDQAVAVAMATPVEVPSAGASPPSGPTGGDGDGTRNGLIRAMAREGRGQNLIASRLGMTRKAWQRLMTTDESVLLAWQAGHAEFEDRVTQALIEQGRKGNVVAHIFLAKTRLSWREQDQTQAPQTNVQIVLPAAQRTEAEYLQFIEANPLQPQPALPPPGKPPFEFTEAEIMPPVRGLNDFGEEDPDQIYVDPRRHLEAKARSLLTLEEREAARDAKAVQRDIDARQRIHQREQIAYDERVRHTAQQQANRAAEIARAKATLAAMTPEECAKALDAMSPGERDILAPDRERDRAADLSALATARRQIR